MQLLRRMPDRGRQSARAMTAGAAAVAELVRTWLAATDRFAPFVRNAIYAALVADVKSRPQAGGGGDWTAAADLADHRSGGDAMGVRQDLAGGGR